MWGSVAEQFTRVVPFVFVPFGWIGAVYILTIPWKVAPEKLPQVGSTGWRFFLLLGSALAIFMTSILFVVLTSAGLEPHEAAGPIFALGMILIISQGPPVAAWIFALLAVIGRALLCARRQHTARNIDGRHDFHRIQGADGKIRSTVSVKAAE